ncbi:MAG: M23 family metallopeptidase [Ramlibacter sp.]|nr:M23 family metallopeptidase [Ramlibacter sp.]
MCRTELLRRAGTLAFVLLATACGREAPRTVVLDPTTGREAVAVRVPVVVPPPAAVPTAPALPQAGLAPTPQLSNGDGAALLAARRLLVPVEGIAPSALHDNYNQVRGAGKHEAMDIMAARGARVFAVDDGKLVKLFKSVPGGLTVYQFDHAGQLAYYYAHLDRYADGLTEGMALKRGDLIGYVGSTGNAAPDAPHQHFAVVRHGPERQWWKGDPINPYPALQGTDR